MEMKICGLWPLFAKSKWQWLRFALDGQDLAAFVIAAGRANRMAPHGAAALRALGQLGPMPAVGCFAGAQPHL